MFFSATPSTGSNVYGTELWKYDKSIHPEIFTKKTFYWWDDCYERSHYQELKQRKELANGLKLGYIFVQKFGDYHVMYSYGTDWDNKCIRKSIVDFKHELIQQGNKCFIKIRDLYCKYYPNSELPKICN